VMACCGLHADTRVPEKSGQFDKTGEVGADRHHVR
jgi:hypothetical protein